MYHRMLLKRMIKLEKSFIEVAETNMISKLKVIKTTFLKNSILNILFCDLHSKRVTCLTRPSWSVRFKVEQKIES